MTVAQLIAALKDLPDDARVIVGHDDVAWDAERVHWMTPEEAFEEFGFQPTPGSPDVVAIYNPD